MSYFFFLFNGSAHVCMHIRICIYSFYVFVHTGIHVHIYVCIVYMLKWFERLRYACACIVLLCVTARMQMYFHRRICESIYNSNTFCCHSPKFVKFPSPWCESFALLFF